MKKTLVIQNLKCGGCAQTIKTRLSELKNIDNVEVDVENSSVSFDSGSINSFFTAKDLLKELGYPTVDVPNSLISKTKSFVSCAKGKLAKE